jgi:2-polyprenyl-3-methyl-5-hydroxy-6-metoxy-1,4-benzoquinol methylase
MMRSLIGKVFARLHSFARRSVTSTASLIEAPLGASAPEYVEIRPEEINDALAASWQDPEIPRRQYDQCTRTELANYAKGLPVLPYDVLVTILKENIVDLDHMRLLEIGCSSGYYSEVIRIKGIGAEYAGCDYSEPFITVARELFPNVDFQVQDACKLGYSDQSFDVVVSGGCLLHILKYEQAITEAARVSRRYVVFHRTPVFHRKETTYYLKTAYGVKMFEIHFNERELLQWMHRAGLAVVDMVTYQPALEERYGDFWGYKTYLCQKI